MLLAVGAPFNGANAAPSANADARSAPVDPAIIKLMQDVDKAGMRARDRLEARHAVELAFESAFAFESAAMDHFHGPQRAGQAACQPNLAVSAATDHAQNFVIGNNWNLRGLVRNERDFTQAR